MKLFTVIILLLSNGVFSQNPFYFNYNVNNGLPSTTIYSISQDSTGIIWITTDAGLVEFNSHNFKNYNYDNGLTDNEIFKIKTDIKGRKWLITLNGKLCYILNGKLYNFSNSKLIRLLSGTSMIMDCYEDDRRNLIFVFWNGEISIINKADEVTKINLHGHFLFGGWFYNDTYYALTGFGIYNTKTHQMEIPVERKKNLKVLHINHRNFFVNLNIINEVVHGNKYSTFLKLPEEEEVLNLYFETEQKLWICTRSGLFLYENKILRQIFYSEFSVSDFIKDKEGNYWLGTLKNGLFFIPTLDLLSYKPHIDDEERITCIAVNSKNEIWAGSDENDYYYKRPGYPFVKNKFTINRFIEKINKIRFFGNNTYITGKQGTIIIDNTKKKTPIVGFGCNDLYIRNNDYLACYAKVYKLNKSSFEKSKPYEILIDERATVIEEGENGSVWIGSMNGVYEYTKNNEIIPWGNKSEKLRNSINNILYDEKGKTLFVASSSLGLLIIENKTIKSQISVKNGLNSISANCVVKYNDSIFFIGTNNGLNKVIRTNNSFKIQNYNSKLGLFHKKINDAAVLNDTIYLATDQGLISFVYTSDYERISEPICKLEYIKNYGKIIEKTEKIQFEYDQNDISFGYIGIYYSNPTDLTYYYTLEGVDKKWSSSKETQINYAALAPGNYTFKIYCSNSMGYKSNTESYYFEILPPFWQTKSFILFSLLFLGIAIALVVKFFLQQQQKNFEKQKIAIELDRNKAELEKQMISLEQKALRLQMNPHFIFNALNTIKGYYSEGDAINASSYISMFSKLLRMLLENTESTIPLSKEIEMLDLYINLTKIRYKNKFVSEIIVDEELKNTDVLIPTLLLQPIVENAIIHGLGPKDSMGLLKISFDKKADLLECIVEDNGIGRAASANGHKEYKSKAIEITTERIALFSQKNSSTFNIIDLTENEKPSGTKVIIKIPLIKIW